MTFLSRTHKHTKKLCCCFCFRFYSMFLVYVSGASLVLFYPRLSLTELLIHCTNNGGFQLNPILEETHEFVASLFRELAQVLPNLRVHIGKLFSDSRLRPRERWLILEHFISHFLLILIRPFGVFLITNL